MLRRDTTYFNATVDRDDASTDAEEWIPDPFQASSLASKLTLTLGVNGPLGYWIEILNKELLYVLAVKYWKIRGILGENKCKRRQEEFFFRQRVITIFIHKSETECRFYLGWKKAGFAIIFRLPELLWWSNCLYYLLQNHGHLKGFTSGLEGPLRCYRLWDTRTARNRENYLTIIAMRHSFRKITFIGIYLVPPVDSRLHLLS